MHLRYHNLSEINIRFAVKRVDLPPEEAPEITINLFRLIKLLFIILTQRLNLAIPATLSILPSPICGGFNINRGVTIGLGKSSSIGFIFTPYQFFP